VHHVGSFVWPFMMHGQRNIKLHSSCFGHITTYPELVICVFAQSLPKDEAIVPSK